ncbi:pheromone receptor [Moniliophthora roreri MCA 2997]|uniref:Pheromone receptor n=2 Tax=Moniliophthora roreri TaxID=221103 RepID=V2X7P5_MONRO|nr:pheromone receptor STE3_Mr4.2 [Moniliophthora roreri]ESK88816.1 pheromone receptor [Moniliophthora roreri MCA 2997]
MSVPKDPTYPLFPIFACLGFILSIIPLPWHIQALNSGTCAFMIWTAALCLVQFVNSVVWSGNVNNIAPVWCDISTQIILGAAVGIPASTLCISRRLYRITSTQTVSITPRDKKKAVIEDICIAAGVPALVLVMHIAVHPHRFDILEDVGCYPTTYNTLPAYFLYFMWPILLGVLSLIYSCLNLRSFYIRRAQFAQFMSSNSAMNMSRYLRLMVLAIVDIMFTIPLGTYVVYAGTHGVPLRPWISWEETHFNFGRVDLVPAIVWRNNPDYLLSMEFSRWLAPFCAILFFALFGFASEAKKNYSAAFWWVAKKFGRHPPPKTGPNVPQPKYKPTENKAGGGILPLYIITKTSSEGQETPCSTLKDVDSPADKSKAFALTSPASSRPPSYTHSETSSPSRSFVTLPDTEHASIYSSPRISISSAYACSSTPSMTTTDHHTIEMTTSAEPNHPASLLATAADDYSIYARTVASSIINETSTSNVAADSQSDPYLRQVQSGNRVYIPEAYYPSQTPQPELPSPPPFKNAAAHSYRQDDRVTSHAGIRGVDGGIFFTVQQSQTTL